MDQSKKRVVGAIVAMPVGVFLLWLSGQFDAEAAQPLLISIGAAVFLYSALVAVWLIVKKVKTSFSRRDVFPVLILCLIGGAFSGMVGGLQYSITPAGEILSAEVSPFLIKLIRTTIFGALLGLIVGLSSTMMTLLVFFWHDKEKVNDDGEESKLMALTRYVIAILIVGLIAAFLGNSLHWIGNGLYYITDGEIYWIGSGLCSTVQDYVAACDVGPISILEIAISLSLFFTMVIFYTSHMISNDRKGAFRISLMFGIGSAILNIVILLAIEPWVGASQERDPLFEQWWGLILFCLPFLVFVIWFLFIAISPPLGKRD